MKNKITSSYKINNIKSLSKEDELYFILKAKAGDLPSKKILILDNFKSAEMIARKFFRQRYSMEPNDLIGEGILGIYKAIDKYDHEIGIRFNKYVMWWIKAYVFNYIEKKGFVIRLPHNKMVNIHKELNLGKVKPSDGVDVLMNINRIYDLDKHVYDSKHVYETIEDTNALQPDRSILNENTLEELTFNVINDLPEDEQSVVKFIYGVQEKKITIKQICKNMNLSEYSVRSLRNKAFKRIKSNKKINKLKDDYMILMDIKKNGKNISPAF